MQHRHEVGHHPGLQALTRSRLVHVDQYYLRADTIAAANAALIEAQGRVPIVRFWGKGLLASVDGLRFVVPTRTINAAPSPKRFAKKKGITWLNAITDQVIGIGQMVVPGTPRDSLFILDALLNLDGGVKPEMVATDNAAYSDMVFGIFKMLGYCFSPRFKDLEDQRFWKAQMPGAEAAGGYGPLEAIARNKVNVKKVITHWPDMLRVAGSLVANQVRAYDLLRMFGREGHPTPLGQAFAEYGRIAKPLHLLAVVDPMDDTYRRQMHKRLTVQESRHKLAREICHGKKGTIHQAYRGGMEDQLSSLGLVLDAVVLWTTRYIEAAVAQLRAEGHGIRDEGVARLSPLKHKNLNVLGRYSFTASQPVDGPRPLRDPDAVDLDDGREKCVVGRGRGPFRLLPPRAVGERDSAGVTDTEGVGRVQQGLTSYRSQLAPLLRRDPTYDVPHVLVLFAAVRGGVRARCPSSLACCRTSRAGKGPLRPTDRGRNGRTHNVCRVVGMRNVPGRTGRDRRGPAGEG